MAHADNFLGGKSFTGPDGSFAVNAVYETSTRFLGQINRKLLSWRAEPFSRLQLRFPLGKKHCVLKA